MSHLPSLGLDEVFSYLSYKEIIKCKQVCRRWKAAIELQEKNRESLVFHLGYFPFNRGWLSNQKLMKISNSFELNSLNPLKAVSTKRYLKKNLPNLRKVHIVNTFTVFQDNFNLIQKFHLYLAAFDQIEELELNGLSFDYDCVLIRLPKLKLCALKEVKGDRLELDCSLLETLILTSRFNRCSNKHPDKLKRLECSERNYLASLKTKLKNLEYLNLFDDNSGVKSDLLKYTPKLKKLVLYTNDGRSELKKLERQKQVYGLPDLKILICGFDIPTVQCEVIDATFSLTDDLTINELFENYPRLVERVTYDVAIDYGLLFKRFRILPDNFFTKLPNIDSITITEVTSYTHLFGFLKHCPRLENLIVQLSKIRDIRFLDQLYLLAPNLRLLTIIEEHPPALFDYDFTFLASLRVLLIRLECKHLPTTFFKMAYKKCPYLLGLQQVHDHNQITVMINKDGDKLRSVGLLASDELGKEVANEFLTFKELSRFMRKSSVTSKYLIRNL